MTRQRISLFSLALSVGIACSDSTTPAPSVLTLRTDATSYVAGSTVIVTAVNMTAEPVSTFLCARELQRKIADRWSAIPGDGACLDILIGIQPHDSLTYQFTLEPTLQTGTYHFLFPEAVYTKKGYLQLSTNEFAVTSR